ncbi:hypothetical protein [Paractinoplanes brasiliensis]|uniref:Uncharacterized protein n=1 Tax=Paractinoplanes brasiliensis TaxID=52695 RepID=A0A4R6JVG0_9ACTN|nr:hypothetical protein [Actinoplanes brasiliensis]TDO40227.1 hypothetical protein C8E87_3938 [Actinoplanes brasiliensis]GID25293.1 hypothetical protein Abr02nite_02760 [Actinoplanes brasiliensis]
MNCRRYGSKPTMLLWLLVAIADLVFLAAAVGPVVTTAIVVLLAVITAAVFAVRVPAKRSVTPDPMTRRRA